MKQCIYGAIVKERDVKQGKKLLNGGEALCLNCQNTGAIFCKDGSIRCKECGRMMLVHKKTKELFLPKFDINNFTPDNSKQTVRSLFPKLRERRKPVIYNHKRIAEGE